jgi:hypothetical protein
LDEQFRLRKVLVNAQAGHVDRLRGTWALAFVTMQHHSEFQKFLSDHQRRELSPSEEKQLSKLGLE